MKALKTDMKYSYEKCTTILNQKLHRMKLIKDNAYANKPLKKPFNLKESIKQEISDGIEKLRNIAIQKQKSIDMSNGELDNSVSKSL